MIGKHPAFTAYLSDPLNGGVPLVELGAHPLTPNDRFFVRSHGDIPMLSPSAYRLRVDGRVRVHLELSLPALAALPQHELTAVLQCAGNRRVELLALGDIPDEILWDTEGVSSAHWSGVRLSDVLALAGIDLPRFETGHIAFEGLDTIQKDDQTFPYGGSIPLDKAGDVLLATHMNGDPLPPEHGFPLRALVPGWIGARSVKWLGRISVQDTPSDNYYQTRAYRHFAPYDRKETADWSAAPMLGELPVNSLITAPAANASLPAGEITVQGLAWGGHPVERVDLSTDGGATWGSTRLAPAGGRWNWRRWSARLHLPAGDYELTARAWDSAANTQPDQLAVVWNWKGYMNNACHRVRIQVG